MFRSWPRHNENVIVIVWNTEVPVVRQSGATYSQTGGSFSLCGHRRLHILMSGLELNHDVDLQSGPE